MKKIVLMIIPAAFILVSNATWAQSPSPSMSPSPTAAPLIKKSITYTFPYPGVLPDNALYKLKMVRDRVGEWLIRDPQRRAEYFLKMADKRMSAAMFLADGGKWDLASNTASKAEVYLSRTIIEAEKAKGEGKDITPFLGKLSTASLKHDEVLTDLWGRADDGPKQSLEKSFIFSRDLYKKVQELTGVKVPEVSPSPSPVKK